MRQTAIVAVLLAIGAPAFALDGQLLNLVMPDARVLAGIDITNAKASAFGRYVLSQIPAGDQGLQELISITGFDPRQDLTEILAATPAQPGSNAGLVVARGNFDVTKITAALKGQTAQTYKGATLILPTNPKDTGALAFIDASSGTSSIAIAGDAVSVKAALDRQNTMNTIDSNLAQQAQALSEVNDAWSVSVAPLASVLPLGAAGGASANQITAVLKDIQSTSGGLKFNDTNVMVTGQAVADTPQNASALGDVIRLIATLVTTNAGANAQAAAAAQILQSLQIQTNGSAVNIALSVPESQLEALLSSGIAPGARAGAARRPAIRNN